VKYIFVVLFIAIINLPIFSQVPESFSFQTVVRNASAQPIANRAISFRFNILKGSSTGQVVYGEKHDVTTDGYGFVGLAIGNGTVLTGSFAAINWGIDKYFLNVGLDTLGGTSYTDMGTTQFLSVPYALYAKTAANGFSGDYNDLYNKPIVNGSETTVTAGDNLTVTGSGTLSNPYKIDVKKHTIGESYGGGIVFYVYDNGQHGLIASTTDQDASVAWYNGTKRYTNTTGDGLGAGEMNTALIVSLQTNDNPTGNFAAKVCADYSVTVNGVMYSDWYLPSKFELEILFINQDFVGGFTNSYYWSSTELSSVSAWCQSFSTGSQLNINKSLPYGVRAIRAF